MTDTSINDGYPHVPLRQATFDDLMALSTVTRRDPADILGELVEAMRSRLEPRLAPASKPGRKPKQSS